MGNINYEWVVNIDDLISSVLPYKVHATILTIQIALAIVLFLWMRAKLFSKPLKSVVQNHKIIPLKLLNSKKTGWIYFGFGLLILAPLVFGFHYLFSGFGLVSLLLFLTFSDWRISFRAQAFRGFLTFCTGLILFFMVWEKADPARQSAYIFGKFLKWRNYEVSWQEIHDKTAPKVGDLAPDFELNSTDGLDTVRLSEFINKKPVALILGSNTCPPHSDGTVIIKELLAKYGDQIAFVMVYLEEAHPIDKWWLGESKTQRTIFNWTGTLGRMDYYAPTTFEERLERARAYRKNLFENQIPIFVDDMDNQIGEMYAAKPTRIYFIGKDGRVIYNPGFGPLSFNPTHLGQEIEKYLSKEKISQK